MTLKTNLLDCLNFFFFFFFFSLSLLSFLVLLAKCSSKDSALFSTRDQFHPGTHVHLSNHPTSQNLSALLLTTTCESWTSVYCLWEKNTLVYYILANISKHRSSQHFQRQTVGANTLGRLARKQRLQADLSQVPEKRDGCHSVPFLLCSASFHLFMTPFSSLFHLLSRLNLTQSSEPCKSPQWYISQSAPKHVVVSAATENS